MTDFIRAWRASAGKDVKAFVPLKFDLGEAFQFDWSEEGLVVGGIYRRMQVSHMKLCASWAFWLVAYPSQGHEMLFDAHTQSFAALGGVARRGIYDLHEDRAHATGIRCRASWRARGSAPGSTQRASAVVANDRVAASHERLSDRGQVCYDWQHYITLLQRTTWGAEKRRALCRHACAIKAFAPRSDAPCWWRADHGAGGWPGVPTAGLNAVLVAVELVIESGRAQC